MDHFHYIQIRRAKVAEALEKLADVLHDDYAMLGQLNKAQPTLERDLQVLDVAISNLTRPHMLYHFERTPTGWVCYDDNYEPPDADGVGGGPTGYGPTKDAALEDLFQ